MSDRVQGPLQVNKNGTEKIIARKICINREWSGEIWKRRVRRGSILSVGTLEQEGHFIHSTVLVKKWITKILVRFDRFSCLPNMSLSNKPYIIRKLTFQGFKWVILFALRRASLVARATKRKIVCFKKLQFWAWSTLSIVTIYTSLERTCSQLSFDALLVKIGWKKAKLTFV